MRARFVITSVLVVTFLVTPHHAHAQDRRIEFSFVEAFKKPLPLEVPFTVVGNAPAFATYVQFSFECVEDDCRDKPKNANGERVKRASKKQRWYPIFDKTAFAFGVDPGLQHRVEYRFSFELGYSVASLEKVRPGTVARIITAARQTVREKFPCLDDQASGCDSAEKPTRRSEGGLQMQADSREEQSVSEIQLLSNALQNTEFVDGVFDDVLSTIMTVPLFAEDPAGAPLNSEGPLLDLDLLNASGTVDLTSLESGWQQKLGQLLLETERARLQFRSNHGNTCAAFRGVEPSLKPLLNVLEGVLNEADLRAHFDASSYRLWGRTLDASRRTTIGDIVSLVARHLSGNTFSLVGVLDGSRRVQGTYPIPTGSESTSCVTGGAQVDSLMMIAEGFRALLELRTTSDQVVDDQALRRVVANAASQLTALANDTASWRSQQAANKKALNSAATRLLGKATAAATATATAVPAKTHPYIGLDLGVAYAPKIDSALFYTAAQIYAVPVNKSAKLTQYYGWNAVWKRTSLLLGLALNDPNGEGREKFSSIGSPMVGVGFRISSGIRLSGGRVWFRETDANPLVTKKISNHAWFGSASVDVDIASFIGNIGKLFGQ